jgi:lipopolysaccharide transport system ATP-binding protein
MGNDVVIRAEHVSKKYTLGQRDVIQDGFRHVLDRVAKAPLSWMRGRGPHQNPLSFYALKDVSFEIGRGEVVGIVGRNGAGKSTLLKIISRITEPTSGRLSIKGRMASLLEVGTGFHGELTGRENIYLNGAILGMRRSEITCRFDEIVAFAEIDRFLDTPVKRYSSGMYVRLAFSVAAHLDPEVLAVDEVLAVGDVAFQRKCLGKMGQVAGSDGRTVLFVSHNIQAIQRLCTTAILLEGGAIARTGTTSDVIAAYLELQSSGRGSGSMRAHHAAILIRSDGSQPDLILEMGAPAKLTVTLEVDRPVRRASLEIGIESLSGDRVLTFDTTLQYAYLWQIEEHAELTIDWPECILAAGQYRFVAALYENDAVFDAWENAGEVTVLETDYFGTGHFPEPTQHGRIVTKAKWRITQDG